MSDRDKLKVTVYWLDDSGAIPAGMSEDLSGWRWGIGVDMGYAYGDGPFVTRQEAILAVWDYCEARSQEVE